MIRKSFLIALLLTAFALIFSSETKAQPWMHSPYLTKKAGQANFYDIRNAFYAWWGDRPIVRGKGYKAFRRWEYRMTPKCYPDGVLPQAGKYYDAYVKFKSGVASQQSKSTWWTPMGLTSWVNGNSGYNPGNGRVNAVTVDRHNPNVIYIAAPSGGIWKTVNGGFTWNTTYDTMKVMGTSAIAIHPNDPNTIFIGTGDRDAWDTPGIGILKSTDGGLSWKSTGMTFNPQGKNVNKILINPLYPANMYAATSAGIYRSKNSGNSWQLCYTASGVNDLKFRPGDTSIIYGSGEVFVRSDNSGLTFSKITATLPHDTGRVEFDVTAANPNVVYVVASRPDNTFEGVYKSTDKGLTFTAMSNSPNILGYSDIGDDDAGQAWYDLAIAVSPTDEDEVWVGGINMWKSTDAGVNWTVNTMWYTNSPYSYIHCDIHSVNFYGDTLYVGSDGGIFFTPDHGYTWNDISNGLGITQFYRLGCSQNDPEHIAAGAQDIGSNVYLNGNWTHVYGADGMEALISYANDDIIYVSSQMGGIIRSADGGQNFDDVKPVDSIDGGWVTPYVQDAVNPDVLYAGYKDVWKTTDGGFNWNPISTNLCGGDNIEQLVVAASNSHYIYASQSNTLYYTYDEGSNWNTSVPNSGMYITGIAVDPLNPLRLWITCTSSSDDRVYYSHDGGQTFTDLTYNLGNLGLNCIVYQENNNDALYVGTETGIVYKDSTMSSWIPWDQDLPKVPVNELEIQKTSGVLRAATYGRGIWQGPLANTVGIQEAKYNSLQISPNPATNKFIVRFPSNLSETVELRLFNMSGNLVKQMSLENKGQSSASVDVSTLAPGNYFIGLKSGKTELYGKVLVAKP
jgi:photosystem II stability/assembly factor-like uncharacterized protein